MIRTKSKTLLDQALRRFAFPLLCLIVAAPAYSQGSTGRVEGGAFGEEDGRPIPFALVRLQPVDSATPPPQRITTAEGRFWFPAVNPGRYRVNLLRIGYRPIISEVITVRAGEIAKHDVRGGTQAVQLATVTVLPELTCLRAGQLSINPQLATLWNEARKGVEIRRGLEQQYRFTRVLRQDIRMRWRVRRASREVRRDTLVNYPDSVSARDQRRQARIRDRGYAEGNSLRQPDEKELLDDQFLNDHCFETTLGEEPGMVGLQFRPVAQHRDKAGIRGTVWIDRDTYLIRRIETEYVRDNRAFASTRVDYADVKVGSSALRLPSEGIATLRAQGATAALLTGATAALSYSYSGFEHQR